MSTVATQPKTNTRRVLLHLLTESPNEVVTHADVCDGLGYAVSRQAVSAAARRLARDMPIDSRGGPGGGYVYLAPEKGRENVCGTCARLGKYGLCKRLDRRVSLSCGCGGWHK